MGSEPLVVDLSSDDGDDSGGGDGFGELKDDLFDWLTELFGGEDDDDVLVVDELSGPPAVKERNLDVLVQKDGSLRDDESDDDCLVLDSDPDKSMRVVNDKVDRGDGEDDLVVVQEKGQVACRDYPHPRHLCANFPFNSSLHVQHCKLCHCYVCDCLAPCKYWGNGDLTTDHCHSTDKVEMWKSQRQMLKRKNTSRQDKLLDKTLTNVPPVQKLLPIHQSNRVPPTTPSATSNPIRPCSAASIRSRSSSNQRHHHKVHNQRYSHYPARPNPLSTGSHTVQREAHLSSLLAPRFVHNHTQFKRAGMTQSGLRLNSSGLNDINNNQTSRPLPSKNYSVTNRLQRSQHLQPGLQTSDYHTSVATGVRMNQLVDINVSKGLQPVPSTLPAYHCQLGPSVNDNKQSWQAMVASMAYDLGVSNNITQSTYAEDPIALFPESLNYTSATSQMNTDQHSNIYPQYFNADDLNPLGNCNSQMNNATVDDIAELGHDEEPKPLTLQLPNFLPPGSNSESASTDDCLESLFASMGKEMLEEAANDMPIPELDPDSPFFDFEVQWSSLAQIQNNS